MRSDMGKVITERERARSRTSVTEKDGAYIRWQGHDGNYDDQPKRAKISAHGRYGWNAKEFTDVLGPLKGYIQKNVGRPWNKVYSEMCQYLDKGKLTHAHVFTHVFQWVGRNVVRCEDGAYREPHEMTSWRSTYAPDFYVHPKTGILMKNKRVRESKQEVAKRRKEERKNRTEIEIDGSSCYKKIDDLWYILKIRVATNFEASEYRAVQLTRFKDAIIFTDKDRAMLDAYAFKQTKVITINNKQYYVQDKRQVGRKDLKKIKDLLES